MSNNKLEYFAQTYIRLIEIRANIDELTITDNIFRNKEGAIYIYNT